MESPASSPEQKRERAYDIVIFGASGFTGRYVVKEALKFLNAGNSPLRSLALAGRSPSKVARALEWASRPCPPPQLPILEADVSDPASLLSLCRTTRLLLDCAGPFRLYGEHVVSACVEAGTDYLDITGEPEFMERMEADYHRRAAERGVLVISSCGFDSVPAELGVMFHTRQWAAPAVPSRVTAYLSMESDRRIVCNIGTYESAVLGMANARSLQELRKSRPRKPRPMIPGPPPPKESLVEKHKELGLWAIKLPSADATVVRRTLATLTTNPDGLPGTNENKEQLEKRRNYWQGIKPVQFGMKICSKSILGVLGIMYTGLLIDLLGSFSLGRSLLFKFPELFTLGIFRRSGPTEEEVSSARFKMWFVGHGYSDGRNAAAASKNGDTEIITRISGPESGYETTRIVLLQCALVVLSQRDALPKGGVFPPGVVFGPTDLQERLQENGISFDVVSRKSIPIL